MDQFGEEQPHPRAIKKLKNAPGSGITPQTQQALASRRKEAWPGHKPKQDPDDNIGTALTDSFTFEPHPEGGYQVMFNEHSKGGVKRYMQDESAPSNKRWTGDAPQRFPDLDSAVQGAMGHPMMQKFMAKRKKALVAEPDFIWSKSPSTVHTEFANRMGSGAHPHEVYRQLIAEIADHHGSGTITNRDAHRAANEAFGRLLMSRKQRQGGAVPAVDAPEEANPQSVVDGPQGRAPLQGGQESQLRKQAWSGWGPKVAPKHHKVAGWEWDEYLNAHIANSPRKFECKCGEKVEVPDYHRCKCGKVWNTYVIGTGGDRREASAEKFIAREVPERENVIIARRITAGYDDHDKALNDWEAEEESMKEFPSNHVPKVDTKVKGNTAPDWHSRDHKTQRWVNKG